MRKLMGIIILFGIILYACISINTSYTSSDNKTSNFLLHDQEEIEVIKKLLNQEEFSKYLDTDLINDGGGIFITTGINFSIMTQKVNLPKFWRRNLNPISETSLETSKTPIPLSSPLAVGTPIPLTDSEIQPSSIPPQTSTIYSSLPSPSNKVLPSPFINIKIDRNNKTALVEFRKERKGNFEFKGEFNEVHTKTIDEIFIRNLQLIKNNNKWELQKISPIVIELSDKSKQTVSINNVTISVNDIEKIKLDSSQLQDKSQILSLKENDYLKVEIKANNIKDYEPKIFAFLHNSIDKRRYLMNDTGEDGDKISGDNIYTSGFKFTKINNTKDIQHLVIDIISPDTLINDSGYYNSTSLGISYTFF